MWIKDTGRINEVQKFLFECGYTWKDGKQNVRCVDYIEYTQDNKILDWYSLRDSINPNFTDAEFLMPKVVCMSHDDLIGLGYDVKKAEYNKNWHVVKGKDVKPNICLASAYGHTIVNKSVLPRIWPKEKTIKIILESGNGLKIQELLYKLGYKWINISSPFSIYPGFHIIIEGKIMSTCGKELKADVTIHERELDAAILL